MQTITIDAQGKKLGRVATEAASILLGKNSTSFARNVVQDVEVRVINAGKLDVTDRKLTSTTYVRYSGYPGGLKKENLAEMSAKKGFAPALTIAISGMLPKNKLRDKRMLRLKVSE